MRTDSEPLYIGYIEKNLPTRRWGITQKVKHSTGIYYVNAQYTLNETKNDYVLRVIRFFHRFKEQSEKANMCSIYSLYMTEMLQKYPNPIDALKELQSRELRKRSGEACTVVGFLADHLIEDYYFERSPHEDTTL